MRRAARKIPQIEETDMPVNAWTGLNTFGPHADLKPGELRTLSNFDNFGDYIKTRRGSQSLIEDFCPDEDILTHAVFDAGDKEYVVVQQTKNNPALPTGLFARAPATNPTAVLNNFIFIIDLSTLPTTWWDEVDTTIGAKGRAAKDVGAIELATDWFQFNNITQTGFVRVSWSGALVTTGIQEIRIYPPRSTNTTLIPTDTYGSDNCYDPANVVMYSPNGGDNDRSSNNLSFTVSGSLVSGDSVGQIGDATSFNGIDESLQAVLTSATKPVTMMAWLNPSAAAVGIMMSTYNDSDVTEMMDLLQDGANSIYQVIGDSGVSTTGISATPATIGEWSHAGGLVGDNITNSVATAYRNGVPGTTIIGTAANPIVNKLNIGVHLNGSAFHFPGLLQELWIFSDEKPGEWIAHEHSQSSDNATFWGTWETVTGDSNFRFCELAPTGIWLPVLTKRTLAEYTVLGLDTKVDMFVSNGKIFVFSTTGNSIFEFDSVTETFLQRKMGLPAPQINEVVSTVEVTSELKGKRIYAVELVYKNTTVTPNVDLIVSGPNRAIFSTGAMTFGEGRFAYAGSATGIEQEFTVKVSTITNDGTDLSGIENDIWTHIRLYRSKDISTATNSVPVAEGGADTEITGTEGELYQVLEVDRVTFLASFSGGQFTFVADTLLDDDLPFPLDFVTVERMDLFPMPAGATGVFHRDRIWCSGVTQFPGPQGVYTLDSIESKIYYTPEAKNQYSEQVGALNAIESDPGDGQKMIGLFSLQEDLIGIKEGKTGRVPYGDPKSGWVVEDEVIGISDRTFAQFVPNIGICAIVNDQTDFRIFGYDLAWHSDLFGLQISRPIRDIIATFAPTDLDFIYMNGKLMISGGTGTILVLATEQKKGWSIYTYPLLNLSEAVFTFDDGKKAIIINRDQRATQIEITDLDTDYNATSDSQAVMNFDLTTHRWQGEEGRELIQQRCLSITAALATNISCQPFVNGKLWDVPFTMIRPPEDYPELALRETEYQGYSEQSPVGNYIHYVITGTAPATIYSIMLNALVQKGQISPDFDPFELLAGSTTTPPWVNVNFALNDAGDEDRDINDFVINDAGDENRDINDFVINDAGTENRE